MKAEEMSLKVKTAFELLSQATSSYYGAQLSALRAKNEHDLAFARAVAEGLLVGKNEDARYGSFVESYPDLIARHMETEETMLTTRAELEIARIHDTYVSRLLMIESGMWAERNPDDPVETNSQES